jgi:hypothetical protein
LGVELRFFEQFFREPIQRALAIFIVIVLCIGEAIAISTLPSPNEGCGRLLSLWHEFRAFIFSVVACFIALSTLVWALVVASPTAEGEHSPGKRDAD